MSDCIFCKLISGELPTSKIYEDNEFFAFNDANPQAKIHFLLVPKKHIASLMNAAEEDIPMLGRMIFKAGELAKAEGLEKSGARFVLNSGSDAGQTVHHLHLHILGGECLCGSFGSR